MNRNTFVNLLATVGTVFTLSAVNAGAAGATQPADTILITNKLITLSATRPEKATPAAVAIVGERIAWIGPTVEAAAWQGEETTVIDYGDQASVLSKARVVSSIPATD